MKTVDFLHQIISSPLELKELLNFEANSALNEVNLKKNPEISEEEIEKLKKACLLKKKNEFLKMWLNRFKLAQTQQHLTMVPEEFFNSDYFPDLLQLLLVRDFWPMFKRMPFPYLACKEHEAVAKWQELMNALSSNPFIESLDLSSNPIQRGVGAAITMAFDINVMPSLTHLDLECISLLESYERSFFRSEAVNSAFWRSEVTKSFTNNKKITSLNLSNSWISSTILVGIFNSLAGNSVLQNLNLYSVHPEGDQSVFGAGNLLHNKQLTDLNLEFCRLSAEGITSVLKANEALKTLKISSASLGNLSVSNVIEALKNNNSLTSLHLRTYSLDFEESRKFVAFCRSHPTLQRIVFPRTDRSPMPDSLIFDVSDLLSLEDSNIAFFDMGIECGIQTRTIFKQAVKKNYSLLSNCYNQSILCAVCAERNVAFKNTRELFENRYVGHSLLGVPQFSDICVIFPKK